MTLDELKQSMSTLDDVLAEKSGIDINLDTTTCDTAQKRILKQYRKGATSSAILAVVFTTLWCARIDQNVFPLAYKLYLGVFMAAATAWYIFLYFKTKSIYVYASTPMQTMRKVASLRLYALAGEISFGMALVVFFTLFLSNLWAVKEYTFWIVLSAITIFLIIGIIFYLPRTIRNFKNLTATK